MPDFFRVQFGIVSRSEGHCAAKRSAYQSCGVIVAHDGERFDFSRKKAEHVATLMLTPQDAPDWTRSPESLWQCAAAAEMRVDAQEARIVDFSMPRSVPTELWGACIRHVYEPFIDMGMAMQIDIHDSPASDGGRNINVHGLATLREFDGDGFASRKNRAWNDRFRERNGRAVREAFAERLTEFCQGHGIEYVGDPRSNAERDLPNPEPHLPRWNFEAFRRDGEMPETLATLQEHRARRCEWEAARAEQIEAALDLARIETRIRERRQRRLSPTGSAGTRPGKRDRRAAILRTWHGGNWIDADAVSAIAATRYDEHRGCLWIDLQDGGTLVDRGDFIALRGRLTWMAAVETAAAAERHGWAEVQVSGDQAYKDAVTVAAMLRGITVTNHELSPKAQVQLDRLLAERATERIKNPEQQPRHEGDRPHEGSLRRRSSREIHLELTQQACVTDASLAADLDSHPAAPVLKPRFRKPAPRQCPAIRSPFE